MHEFRIEMILKLHEGSATTLLYHPAPVRSSPLKSTGNVTVLVLGSPHILALIIVWSLHLSVLADVVVLFAFAHVFALWP